MIAPVAGSGSCPAWTAFVPKPWFFSLMLRRLSARREIPAEQRRGHSIRARDPGADAAYAARKRRHACRVRVAAERRRRKEKHEETTEPLPTNSPHNVEMRPEPADGD